MTKAVDSLQGFTSYRMEGKSGRDTTILIPAGDFYVSWQPVGDIRIPIGLDRNNRNKSQYLYQNFSGVWQQVSHADSVGIGAVMIHPIFGNTPVKNTSDVKENLVKVAN